MCGLTGGGPCQPSRDGAVAQRASKILIAQPPRCFGAAARTCRNPRLRLTVVPTPAVDGHVSSSASTASHQSSRWESRVRLK